MSSFQLTNSVTDQIKKAAQSYGACRTGIARLDRVPDYVAEAEHSLSTRLGRACHISRGRKKGKVEIEYYGVDDLNDLLEALEKLGK